jgi:hypothetical protein
VGSVLVNPLLFHVPGRNADPDPTMDRGRVVLGRGALVLSRKERVGPHVQSCGTGGPFGMVAIGSHETY